MTILTALIIRENYPEYLSIDAALQENGMFAAFIHLTTSKRHRLIIQTKPAFSDAEKAKSTLHKICKELQELPNL